MRFAYWMLAAVFSVLVQSVPGAESSAARPANVIVVLADDLGAKELACYGNKGHRTPHLDRLASEGVRFETAYATPLCSPTRVALMTGQYAFRTGWYNLIGRPLSPKPESPAHDIGAKHTFGKMMKSRGYATALAGKWQLSGEQPTLIRECGFDEYLMWAYTHNLPEGVTHAGGFEDKKGSKTSRYWNPSLVKTGVYVPTRADDYGPDVMNAFVIDFIQRHKEGPFFVYYPSLLTHSPHDATPDPEVAGGKWPKGFKSNLEYLDHLMGRLIAEVDRLGLRENTWIFFVGDNGTGGSGKGTITELGARVPFIVRGPGVKAGLVSRALTDITDIYATLAAISGAAVPESHVLDGKNLLPVLKGETEKHRDWIFSYLEHGRILRDGRWLLESPGKGKPDRLYDCGDSRDGTGYVLMDPAAGGEAGTARDRFAALLEKLPGPDSFPDLRLQGGGNNGSDGVKKKKKTTEEE